MRLLIILTSVMLGASASAQGGGISVGGIHIEVPGAPEITISDSLSVVVDSQPAIEVEHVDQVENITSGDELKTAGSVDFPTIPDIIIPPVPNNNPVQAQIEKDLAAILKPLSGVRVESAQCDSAGEVIVNANIVSVDTQKTLDAVTANGTFTINRDGSGNAVVDGLVYESDGDGAGSITGRGATFETDGDGSGSYVGKYGVIELDGDGGGQWSGGKAGVITNNGDGSGEWTGGAQGVIEINADGSGSWVGGPLGIIENHGDGTGTINGKAVKMAPLPPVQRAGKFPPIQAFNPPKVSCGVLITLSDQILFDFDKHALRDSVKPYLDILAKALVKIDNAIIQVRGHTDSKGSDDYNQTLSVKRAETVRQALIDLGVNGKLSAVGFGETRPVAKNQINGKDNPAGRQLNRRVEIFIAN